MVISLHTGMKGLSWHPGASVTTWTSIPQSGDDHGLLEIPTSLHLLTINSTTVTIVKLSLSLSLIIYRALLKQYRAETKVLYIKEYKKKIYKYKSIQNKNKYRQTQQ